MFELFGLFHILFILFFFIVTGVCSYLITKVEPKKREKISYILATIVLIFIVSRSIYSAIRSDELLIIFPFQVCALASVIVVISIYLKSSVAATMAVCLHLPFAFISVFFADALVNYPNFGFRVLNYLIYHAFITGVIVVFVAGNIYKYNPKSLKKAILYVTIIYIITIPLNVIVHKYINDNYFYSLHADGTPLELFNKLPHLDLKINGVTVNFVYSLGVYLVGLAVCLIFFYLFKLCDRVFSKNLKKF